MHSGGLEGNQLYSGQTRDSLTVLQRVFEIAPRHLGVLAGQHFGAESVATRNRFDNTAVLIGRDQKQLLQIGGYELPFQESAR